jgi:radical SAM protein with 4Fe4S-binding SPASM domain
MKSETIALETGVRTRLSREALLGGAEYPITWELYPAMTCNLSCAYCYNGHKARELARTPLPTYPLPDLLAFLNYYARSGDIISFTGGEPFFRIKWLESLVAATENSGFIYSAYTNGTLLEKAPLSLLRHFSHLNVSLDGGEEATDRMRGDGTFQAVLRNLAFIRSSFTGQIAARMTVTPSGRLSESVRALLEIFRFDLIYWQYQNRAALDGSFGERQEADLLALLRFWLERLNEGQVLPLYPFMAITGKLLGERQYPGFPPPLSPGCGAGYNYVQIFTDGDCYACPELLLHREALMGSLRDGLCRRVGISDFPGVSSCHSCEVFDICHARCLHFRPPEYCRLILIAVRFLRERLPAIRLLIEQGRLKCGDFALHRGLEEIF